jgi:hypothetical protein
MVMTVPSRSSLSADLAADRHGFIEECYFTYSHGPLKDARGCVVGVQTAVMETTSRVLSERRMRTLRDLLRFGSAQLLGVRRERRREPVQAIDRKRPLGPTFRAEC